MPHGLTGIRVGSEIVPVRNFGRARSGQTN